MNELSWLAGFFDGEGYVGLQAHKRSPKNPQIYLGISVVNTDRRALVLFQARFGGGVYHRTFKPGQKQLYQWQLAGRRAYDALRELLPELLVKKEQAELAIRFWELPWRTKRGNTGGTWQENRERTVDQVVMDMALYHRMKALKKA